MEQAVGSHVPLTDPDADAQIERPARAPRAGATVRRRRDAGVVRVVALFFVFGSGFGLGELQRVRQGLSGERSGNAGDRS